MENASKALLIAAAVLLAIFLVTLGITIFNSIQNVSKEGEELGSLLSSSSKDAADKIENSIGESKWTQNKTVIFKGSLTLEVGDYINYNSGVKGYNDEYGWRILGVENGQLLILSNKISERVQLSIQEGFDVEKLDYACEEYKKGRGAASARALKIEDIDRVTGYKPSQYNGYGNEVTYTLEDGSSTTLKSTYYYYQVADYLKQSPKAYDMLCGQSYPLSSIGITTYNNYANFSLRVVYNTYVGGNFLYDTTGRTDWYNAYPRAVVYLKQDVKLENNSSIWEIK